MIKFFDASIGRDHDHAYTQCQLELEARALASLSRSGAGSRYVTVVVTAGVMAHGQCLSQCLYLGILNLYLHMISSHLGLQACAATGACTADSECPSWTLPEGPRELPRASG